MDRVARRFVELAPAELQNGHGLPAAQPRASVKREIEIPAGGAGRVFIFHAAK